MLRANFASSADVRRNMASSNIIGSGNKRSLFDFYSTPPRAIDELFAHEDFTGNVWECACGNGSMAQAISAHGFDVISSDLRNTGFGEGGVNFLSRTLQVDNIITNPSFALAEKFVLHSLKCARKKVAMLLKLAWLEGDRRYKLFMSTPLSKVIVFSKRLTLHREAVATSAGMMAFAWFVWEHGNNKNPEIAWCNYTPLQNTMETCHTSPNSGRDAMPQQVELKL